jgi:hypothetical protein
MGHRASVVAALALALTARAPTADARGTVADFPYAELSFSSSQPPVAPRWRHFGDAWVSPDAGSLVLTDDVPSQSGAAVCVHPASRIGHVWRIDLTVRISGRGVSLAGDGMALFLTREPIAMPVQQDGEGEKGERPDRPRGPRALGGPVSWEGLGIFIDTFDNDPGQGENAHRHPYVSAMVNDGTLVLEHDAAGTHTTLHEPAGCSARVRYAEESPQQFFTIRLEYDGPSRRLRASHVTLPSEGEYVSLPPPMWASCFDLKEVELPPGYFLGLSASTGDLSDRHTAVSLMVHGEDGAMEGDVPPEVRAGWPGFEARLGPLSPREEEEREEQAERKAADAAPGGGVDGEDDIGAIPHHHEEVEEGGAGGPRRLAADAQMQQQHKEEDAAALAMDEQGAPPHVHEVAESTEEPPSWGRNGGGGGAGGGTDPLVFEAAIAETASFVYMKSRVEATASGLTNLKYQLDGRVDGECAREGGPGNVCRKCPTTSSPHTLSLPSQPCTSTWRSSSSASGSPRLVSTTGSRPWRPTSAPASPSSSGRRPRPRGASGSAWPSSGSSPSSSPWAGLPTTPR